MTRFLTFVLVSLLSVSAFAETDPYQETRQAFEKSATTHPFFKDAYGYALFPTIGKAGFWFGGAYGEGRVFKQDSYVGDTSMVQATVGFQLGGQAYSQIIFFEDKEAFDKFTSGSFEFSAQASATVLTANASVEAGTKGSSAVASAYKEKATTSGSYLNGMATFMIVKGGLMYEASIGGQKFDFTPKK